MKKVLLVGLMLLQSFVYAGPVCGNHVSTEESMACCEKGHHDEAPASIGESHSSSCCSTCDMGKAPGLKKEKENREMVSIAMPLIPLANQAPSVSFEADDQSWDNQTFASYSPPQIFILNASLRI